MFCKTCGKELNDDASFCNECGTPVGQVAISNTFVNDDRKKEDNVVRLEIRPTFVLGYQIFKEIGNLLWVIVICYACGLNLLALFRLFPIATTIVTLLIIIMRLIFTRAQYNRISYEFLKTKVEYVDGFLNKEEKQLKYEHVREVTMSQNVLERIFGIGRIRLYTNAGGAYNTGVNHKQTGKNGVDIHCVVNVREQYLAAKAILDEIDEE